MSLSISNINWVDILSLTLLFRTTYIGLHKGFIAEFFKGVGVFLSLVLSLHYYSKLASLITKRIPLPPAFSDTLVFLSLCLLTILVFKFIRDAIFFLFKIEPKSFLDKSGGILLGLLRGILIISILLFTLNLSRINYFKESIDNSMAGLKLMKAGPGVYEWSFENFIRLFFPNEELNKVVFENSKEENKPR